MAANQQIIVLFLSIVCFAQLIECNVLFRFSINFNIGKGNNTFENEILINKSEPVSNNHISIKDSKNSDNDESENLLKEALNAEHTNRFTTSAPITANSLIRSSDEGLNEQEKLHASIDNRLRNTQAAVVELNQDLYPLTGRNDEIADVVKETVRYANKVDALLARKRDETPAAMMDKLRLLAEFVSLVHPWKVSSQDSDGNLVKEYADYINALAKHQFPKKQKEVLEETEKAMEAWLKFEQSKIVDVK